jgi:hypothetical protein
MKRAANSASNSTGIVQENANDLMDACDTIFVEKGRGVNGCSVEEPYWGLDPGMGRVLGACRLCV